MKSIGFFLVLLGAVTAGPVTLAEGTGSSSLSSSSSSPPTAIDRTQNVTYQGVHRSGVEAFLGIQYGRDTSGPNRFKPPIAYAYTSGSTVAAQTPGPACPQALRVLSTGFHLLLSNITDVSEDCLLLNVNRPTGTTSNSSLPVMVYIHGGSFLLSSKDELTTQPSGLVLESVDNGHPVVHVGLNYRLGSFGFAQSAALEQEGSENAGLRDQRLGIEWVRDNIAVFGGDPDRITIFGQSSGGLAVGMQIMAYGASKPVPFQQGICQSQALENGITGNFTRTVMERWVAATACNTTDLDGTDTIACLRNLTMQELLDAQAQTDSYTPSANGGDQWLPVVDGDFLPDAPSALIAQGKIANVSAMIGWCDGDANNFPSANITTAQDTDQYIRDYLPGLNDTSVQTLESLYPVTDFGPDPAANLSAEYFRTARIIRDVLFTCSAIHYGSALATRGTNEVYLYDQNQTFLGPALAANGLPGLGPIHTSDIAYVFGNLSHYDVYRYPFEPNATDYALLRRESRSWSTFAATGRPSKAVKNGTTTTTTTTTLQGWTAAFGSNTTVDIFVVGGPREGLQAWSSPSSSSLLAPRADDACGTNDALVAQRLEERCGFLNSADIIRQLNY